MRQHLSDIFEILKYSIALILHMVLIMQFAVLLNKSINIL